MIISDKLKLFKSGEVKSFVISKGIAWNLNLERSPWFYERLVAIAKYSSRKVLRKNNFNYMELTTKLQEAEFVIN